MDYLKILSFIFLLLDFGGCLWGSVYSDTLQEIQTKQRKHLMQWQTVVQMLVFKHSESLDIQTSFS